MAVNQTPWGQRSRSVTPDGRRAGNGRNTQGADATGEPDLALENPPRGIPSVSIGRVTEIPRGAVGRTARLAALPLGFAGRAALGLGKRVTGMASDVISAEIQLRTAEHLFKVLGQLKGGAMKMGQAMSVFEAALPEEIAGPYRAALTKLQEAAPPLPAPTVHKVLAEQLGLRWRQRFKELDDVPAAAASVGQVHRAIWPDGPMVAVKVQYPGAGDALLADLGQLSRLASLFRVVQPGLDVKPLVSELRARVTEELDYELVAAAQKTFAKAYADDDEILGPRVVAAMPQVLVTEWVGGTPLSKVIASGSTAQRDLAGLRLASLHFSAPTKAGLLHADPHPGNFRLLDDGRLGVLDFGAVDRLPDGLPVIFGRLLRIMHDPAPDVASVERELRANGFLRAGISVDLEELRAFLAPLA